MKNFGLLVCLLLVAKVVSYPEYTYDDNQGNDDDDFDGSVDVASTPAFNVAPQVFTPEVGDTVRLPCTSDQNQTDVLIFERKSLDNPENDMLIAAGPMFFNSKRDERFSKVDNVFIIKDIKKSDSAYYECRYQFQNNKINVTHTVIVYYQPTITPKQKRIEVTKGEQATLNCKADGNPTPTIVWNKQDGVMPSGNAKEEGLSIAFEAVDRHYAGSYTCTADNGVGTPATAMREIVVSYPPEIRTENEVVHTGNGARVELVCVVHAHPGAKVSWSHNGEPVAAATHAEVHNGGHRHLLTIEEVSDQDIGHYSCQATNDFGTTTENIYLTDAPSNPSITSGPHSAKEDSYTLIWTTNSFYPITSYELMYRKTKANESSDEPGEWMKVDEIPEEESQDGVLRTFHQTLTDLARASDYEAELSISNEVKPAELVSFKFSTRKEETTEHQQTSGTGRVSFNVLLQAFSTLLLAAIILPS
uniref:Protein amalgam-like n=1 Tax=Hirondellea gigas TaxID=1518452 RepID=A0A2P2HX06_9CRUS